MGIKISEMTTTGSAPADSYMLLAHNGENYKVAPSNIASTSGLSGSSDEYVPVATIYYTDAQVLSYLLQPGTYTLGAAQYADGHSTTGTINIVGGGTYTWKSGDRVYVQIDAPSSGGNTSINSHYTSVTTPKLLSSSWTAVSTLHYKLKISNSTGQITTAHYSGGNSAFDWRSLAFTIWRKPQFTIL
tara:strand:+ start:945 stop:1505 length:561 start_codon:yes stop_codon:yes gene_type:complete